MDDHESMEISDYSVDSSMSMNESSFQNHPSLTPLKESPISSAERRCLATSTPQREITSSIGIRHLSSVYGKVGEISHKRDFPSESFTSTHLSHSTKTYRRKSAPPLVSNTQLKKNSSPKKKAGNWSEAISESPEKSNNSSNVLDQDKKKGTTGKVSPPSVKNKIYLMFALLGIFIFIQMFLIWRHPNLGCHLTVSVSQMEEVLKMNVFGQHIATSVISNIAEEINMKMSKSSNRTHTVVSFHGWTGVGKNHIATLFSKIFSPSKVKIFITPIHFAHSSLDSYYELNIPVWVKTNITKCIMNIFVFDEMDKASPGIIRGIRHALLGVNSSSEAKTWTLFMFLSNSRASDINNFVFSQLQSGRERQSLKHSEFDPILLDEEGESSWFGQLYREKLIHYLVPFLPLGETHVRQCIKRDLRMKQKVPYDDLVEKVIGELPFYQPFQSSERYSTTGCKRVSDKVDFHIYDDV